MSTVKWEANETVQTALSTELNSLANGSFCTPSSAIDNASGLYRWMDIELYLASLTTGTGNPNIPIWLILCLDGTNYERTPDGSGDKIPDAIIPLKPSVTQTHRIIISNIPIPPLKFKIVLQNNSGGAFASSGNTLKYARHYEQVI